MSPRLTPALGLALVALLAGACRHQVPALRPVAVVPATMPEATLLDAPSIGDAQWAAVFRDEALQGLIRTALERNDSLQVAAARVLEAQAALGVVRADEQPQVSAGASGLSQRTSTAFGFPSRQANVMQLQGSAAWELDFWHRLRDATDAARAQLLATGWAERAVRVTVVQQVADAYFRLRAYDDSLEIATRTLATRRESLRLTQIREQGGATSMVDVRQAEQLVSSASLEIVNLRKAMALEEHLLSVLVGGLPGPITRGQPLSEQPHPDEIPAGLPSALLERRPDIQQAEALLVAADAQLAAARTLFFPRITLTGTGGLQSAALTALFSGGAGIWSAVAAGTVPVFTAGRTRAQIAAASARRDAAAAGYQQAIHQAFREAADALVAYRSARDLRLEQARLLAAARDSRRLADLRYQGGATSYLEVLDADTRLFAAELGASQARLGELSSLVSVYRALGGGWQP